MDEDCLYLNVWAPAKTSAPAAVLVWVHGGGFIGGSATVPVYDGAALARRGIVVVDVNYRLGVLGFFAHPDLTREAAGAPPANFGFQDQIAALKWVRDNIAQFGGDPGRVTIAGQSAGAISIHALIASPLAKGLFHAAISQSGVPLMPTLSPLADAEAGGVGFAKSVGAPSVAALRAMSPEQLAGGKPLIPIDGTLLPVTAARVEDEAASNVPVLVGMTADEGSALLPFYGSDDPAIIEKLAGKSAEALRVVDLYRTPDTDARRAANKQFLADRGLAAIDRWARLRASLGAAPVYAYLFEHVEPGPHKARYGAFHSSEIPYVFGTLDTAPERGFQPIDRELSDRMAGLWVSFVKDHRPRASGIDAWPKYDGTAPMIMDIGERIAPRQLLPADKLNAWRAAAAAGTKVTLF